MKLITCEVHIRLWIRWKFCCLVQISKTWGTLSLQYHLPEVSLQLYSSPSHPGREQPLSPQPINIFSNYHQMKITVDIKTNKKHCTYCDFIAWLMVPFTNLNLQKHWLKKVNLTTIKYQIRESIYSRKLKRAPLDMLEPHSNLWNSLVIKKIV